MEYCKKRQYIVILIILFFLVGTFKIETRRGKSQNIMIKNVSAITPVVNTILVENNSLEDSCGIACTKDNMIFLVISHYQIDSTAGDHEAYIQKLDSNGTLIQRQLMVSNTSFSTSPHLISEFFTLRSDYEKRIILLRINDIEYTPANTIIGFQFDPLITSSLVLLVVLIRINKSTRKKNSC